MKKTLILAAALSVLILAGCRGTAYINGRACDTLYDSEERELQSLAVATLKHNLGNDNIITQSEYRSVLCTPPKIKIVYYADLIGRAEYTWHFPKRTTTVVIQGEFLNEKTRLVFVSIDPKQSDIIDTTHKLPPSAPIFHEKRK